MEESVRFEKKVGIISFIALTIIGLLIFYFMVERVANSYYPLRVKFRFIGDLKKGAPVKYLGGMDIGYIKDIYISDNYVEALIMIKKGVEIKAGAEFSIYTVGMFGTRYIEIDPPPILSSTGMLKPGDVVWGNDAMGIEIIQQNLDSITKKTIYSKKNKNYTSFDTIMDRLSYSLASMNKNIKYVRPGFKKGMNVANNDLNNIFNKIVTLEKQLNEFNGRLKNIKKDDIENYFSGIKQADDILNNLNSSLENVIDIATKLSYDTKSLLDKNSVSYKLIFSDDIYDNLYETSENLESFTEDLYEKSVFSMFLK